MAVEGRVVTSEGSGSVIILPNASGGDDFSQVETGKWVKAPAATCSFELVTSDTTAPSCSVEIHMSNDPDAIPSNPGTWAGTLTVTNTALGRDTLSKDKAAYLYKCARCVSIGGASAKGTVKMGF